LFTVLLLLLLLLLLGLLLLLFIFLSRYLTVNKDFEFATPWETRHSGCRSEGMELTPAFRQSTGQQSDISTTSKEETFHGVTPA